MSRAERKRRRHAAVALALELLSRDYAVALRNRGWPKVRWLRERITRAGREDYRLRSAR